LPGGHRIDPDAVTPELVGKGPRQGNDSRFRIADAAGPDLTTGPGRRVTSVVPYSPTGGGYTSRM
jgi:hypothetical protein